MCIDDKIVSALSQICANVSPNRYEGTSTEYIVFTTGERSALAADDDEQETNISVRVHYVLPHAINPNEKKRQIKTALKAIADSTISITNASESAYQHYVFDFSAVKDEP